MFLIYFFWFMVVIVTYYVVYLFYLARSKPVEVKNVHNLKEPALVYAKTIYEGEGYRTILP